MLFTPVDVGAQSGKYKDEQKTLQVASDAAQQADDKFTRLGRLLPSYSHDEKAFYKTREGGQRPSSVLPENSVLRREWFCEQRHSSPARGQMTLRIAERLAAILLVSLLPLWVLGGDFVVKVPGTVERSQIKFSGNLAPEPEQARIVRPSSQTRSGSQENQQTTKLVTPKGRVVTLTNSERLSEIKSPVPVEAEVTVTKRGATITEVKADSVAALNRLKQAKLLSKSRQEKVNAAVKEVDAATEEAIIGKAGPEKKDEILGAYNDLLLTLLQAYRETSDYDEKFQLASAIDGVHKEYSAWEQVNFTSNTKKTDKAESAANPSPGSATVPKSYTFPVNPDTVYEGYQSLQQRVSVVFYKTIYESSRACAGIAIHHSIVFASGVLIGNRLVLTCAHTVVRPSNTGDPPPKRDLLDIRFGYDSPPDPASPQFECKAKVVFEGKNLESEQDPLDFALLETTKPLPDGINPLPLNVAPVPEGTKFFIPGYAYAQPRGVVDYGEVRFPYEIDETARELYRSRLPKEASNQNDLSELEKAFDRGYPTGDLKNGKPIFRCRYGRKCPAIGAICMVSSGNSGGPAVLRTEEGGVFGILVEGMQGNQLPYQPGWRNHEILLPVRAIVEELDRDFNGWRQKYNVIVNGESGS